MTAFAHHFAFEFRTGIRNRTMLFMNYLFPLGLYLMLGFVMPTVNPLFRDAIIPAMVTFAVLAAALLGMPDPLVTARETGIFRSYKINGIPSLSILVIPALTTLLHLTIVAAIITATAPLLFGAPLPEHWLNYGVVFLGLAVACVGLGALIGVVAPNTRMTVLYSQVIFIPSMILGGMMIPLSMLPGAVGKIARLLPASHAMNGFDGLAMGGAAEFNPWASVLVLLACGILAFILAGYLFSWDSRNTARRGHPVVALAVLIPFAISLLW